MFKKKYALVIKENNLMINFAVKLRRYSRSLEKILKQLDISRSFIRTFAVRELRRYSRSLGKILK